MKTEFIIFKRAMYVCVCNAITDDEVAEAIAAGACTREEVTKACAAGGDCGTCHAMIEDLIDAARLVRERAA